MHAYTSIITHYYTSLWVCLSCKTVDAKLSILFPDDNMENDKSVASTRGAKVGEGWGGSQPSPEFWRGVLGGWTPLIFRDFF